MYRESMQASMRSSWCKCCRHCPLPVSRVTSCKLILLRIREHYFLNVLAKYNVAKLHLKCISEVDFSDTSESSLL